MRISDWSSDVCSSDLENTAGTEVAGADAAAGDPGTDRRDDSALHGRVELSIDISDDQKDVVCAALRESGATDIRTHSMHSSPYRTSADLKSGFWTWPRLKPDGGWRTFWGSSL